MKLVGKLSGADTGTIHYRDANFQGRKGWKEVIANPLPGTVFTDLGRQGRKLPYRLKTNDETAPVIQWFAEAGKKVEPLGRGVPHVATAERKQSDWATVTELHASYTDYCLANHLPPLGLVRFGRKLASHLGATYPLYRFGASRLPCVLTRTETEVPA